MPVKWIYWRGSSIGSKLKTIIGWIDMQKWQLFWWTGNRVSAYDTQYTLLWCCAVFFRHFFERLSVFCSYDLVSRFVAIVIVLHVWRRQRNHQFFFKVAQWTLSYISVSFVEASVRSMSSKSSYFYRLNAYAYRNVHLSSQVECEVMCFLNTAYSWIWMLAIICCSPYPVSVATKRHNPPRESSMKSNSQTKHKETFLHIQNHQ